MKALGIILAGGSSNRMKALTTKRALAAMPVACSYRAIDFALSNMTNSGIQTVAVLSQYNTRSLSAHLNSSKWWNFGRKQGGLFLFAPTVTPENNWWYRGTADAMWQNLDFLTSHHEPYVVIAGGDGIYRIDYEDMLQYHIDKGAELTIACAPIPKDDDPSRFGIVKMDSNGLIVDFEEKPTVAKTNMVSAGIYIIRRRTLIELLEKSNYEDRHSFVTDIVARGMGDKKTYGYKLDGYWDSIGSIESYYRVNMDMLKRDVREHFFKGPGKIYSKMFDLPPAKYNEGSKVTNSLVGSGTIVNSHIEDSVVFKNVFIGSNCFIKNSIILHGAYIGDDVHVENCIVEANETLANGTRYIGEHGIRVVSEGHK